MQPPEEWELVPPGDEALEKRLAQAVTTHATPVGSGTVARSRRIGVEERAEAAVIAWMRHQTTLCNDKCAHGAIRDYPIWACQMLTDRGGAG